MQSGGDRISSLPDNVRDQILMSMPLRDAARSSILSSKWRNLWSNLPRLVFDENFGMDILTGATFVSKVTMLEVCRVLVLHCGPLREISISLSTFGAEQIGQVLLFLPHNTIESLTIVCGVYCKLSTTMFKSFSQLKTLRLSCFTFPFSPVSLQGFDRLSVLELRDVMFEEGQPQLRFRCPMLAALILDRFGSSSASPHIVVEDAQKLGCLFIVGCFSSINLECGTLLENITLRETSLGSKNSNINLLVNRSPGFSSVVSLSVRNGWKLHPSVDQWVKLRRLSIDELRLSRPRDVWSVIRMITNSPNLQLLAILMANKRCPGVDESADGITEFGDAASKNEQSRLLTKVEVKLLTGTEHEMALIGWILKSSPALDKMEIQLSAALSDAEKVSVVIKLNGLKRASSEARILIN